MFADRGMNDPFGIALYPSRPEPQFLYVANTDSVVRFPYRNGDTKARGPAEKLGAETLRRRVTRVAVVIGHADIVFSPDGKKMYRLRRLTLECFRIGDRKRTALGSSSSTRTALGGRFSPGEFETQWESHFDRHERALDEHK